MAFKDKLKVIPTEESVALVDAIGRGFKKSMNLTFTDQMIEDCLEAVMEHNAADMERGFRGNVPTSIVRVVEKHTSVFLNRQTLARVREIIYPSLHNYYVEVNEKLDRIKIRCKQGVSPKCPGTDVPQSVDKFYVKRRPNIGRIEIERSCKACCAFIAHEKYERNKRL